MSTFSTSTSQLATVPNSWVVVPMRAYTAARRRGRQLARHAPDLLRRDARGRRHALGREGHEQLLHLLEPLHVIGQGAGIHQATPR